MVTRSTFRAFIVLSILIVLGYVIFYLYTTAGTSATISFSGDEPCILEGGKCRTSCFGNEYEDNICIEGKKCCKKKEANKEADTYYYNLAITQKDIALCNRIIDDKASSDCKLLIIDIKYRDFAFKAEDCNKISDTTIKAGCFTDIALKSSSAEVCNFIEELSLKEICFKTFAVEKNEISYCTNQISNDILKDRCYSDIAVSLKDNSICENIQNEKIFNHCILASDPKVNYIDCKTLSETECMLEENCKCFYITPRCSGCPLTKDFESCTFDIGQICKLSNGIWADEECQCSINEAFFENYGCLDCNSLIHKRAKELCWTQL